MPLPHANPHLPPHLREVCDILARGFPARDLDIQVVELAGERGAAERHELEEQSLLRSLRAWTPYAYEVTGGPDISGNLYIFEISSTIGGDRAACAMIAPSKLHANAFFISPTVVPETKAGAERASFKMSDRDARCTTIAFVTAKPLRDLPVPRPNNYGLVAYLCRSYYSFRLPGVRRPGGFCPPKLNAFPCPAPDQFGLDSFEERLDNGIVIAIALATH